MKFGEKYELLESLTTGGVETFVANDKVRGERVLVHILECEAQKPNQPTVQWVLDQFRQIAPEPAGLVLETGRYSGTLYAYLVTKMPDEAALTKWVQLYRSQGHDTQDSPAPVAKPTAESEFPTAEITPKEPQHQRGPGSVTQLFREFDPQAKPPASKVASGEPQEPSQPPPNVKSGVPATPDWDAMTPRISPAKPESNLGSSPDSFSSAFAPRNFASETNSPPPPEKPRPGEFTNFFQSPFRVEGPSNIPAISPLPVESPRKSVGEFTAMFNSPRPEEPSAEAGVAGNESPGAGFTGWLNNPNIASRTSGTAGAPPSGGLPRPITDNSSAFPSPVQEPFVPPQPASYVTPTPPIVPLPAPPVFSIPSLPNPVIEKHPVAPNVTPSDGATNAFNRPVSEPAPFQPASSGPSAYTQVISMKRPVGSAGAQKEGMPSSGATPFPSVPMPTVSAIAPPPMPAAPARPKLAVPPAPKAPKVGVPEPPVSYWPLILTLTVLSFIAALLVLYFALKH
jgi:hypothetical protein